MDAILSLLISSLVFLVSAALLDVYLFMEMRKVKTVVYVSIGCVGDFLTFIAKYKDLEKPEEELARLSKMTPSEIKIEIEKNGIISILEGIAKADLKNLKSAVPDAHKVLAPIEKRYQR